MPFTESQSQIAKEVFANDARLKLALVRMANNKKIQADRPNFHNWVSLMATAADSRITRGLPMLSEAQRKRTFNEVMKQADYLLTLRTATPAPVASDTEMEEAEHYAEQDAV